MTRIRRLFQRCEMDQNEVNILRGILTSVQQKRRAAGAHAAADQVTTTGQDTAAGAHPKAER
jgi:tRNA C32,U32 (ribose-2'-O)-methylase TrmJ